MLAKDLIDIWNYGLWLVWVPREGMFGIDRAYWASGEAEFCMIAFSDPTLAAGHWV